MIRRFAVKATLLIMWPIAFSLFVAFMAISWALWKLDNDHTFLEKLAAISWKD